MVTAHSKLNAEPAHLSLQFAASDITSVDHEHRDDSLAVGGPDVMLSACQL
jgi:hypothetical protein